jgi:hypothetical protein
MIEEEAQYHGVSVSVSCEIITAVWRKSTTKLLAI